MCESTTAKRSRVQSRRLRPNKQLHDDSRNEQECHGKVIRFKHQKTGFVYIHPMRDLENL